MMTTSRNSDQRLVHRHDEIIPADGHSDQRLIHRHDETVPQSSSYTTAAAATNTTRSSMGKNRDHDFSHQFSMALTIAGMGLSLVMTVFALFHVDVFLRVYRLPIRSYSTGNLIIMVVNTSNDLFGAYLLDTAATTMNRSDLVGLSGVILAVAFL